jgi:hypothetical protein
MNVVQNRMTLGQDVSSPPADVTSWLSNNFWLVAVGFSLFWLGGAFEPQRRVRESRARGIRETISKQQKRLRELER